MTIAYFYPPQTLVNKDITFFKHLPNINIVHNSCNETVDIIYVASVSQLRKAISAKEQYMKPLICWVWDLPYNSNSEWDLTPIGKTENGNRPNDCIKKANLLKLCDLVISASKWTQLVLKEQYNINSEQIYFYIDTDELDSIKCRKKENRIIQISRFAWNKKFENSIYSCNSIVNYELAMVGIKNSDTYFNYINGLKSKNSKFHINIPRKKTLELLKSSEILVSPSVFEGWGISPVESLYCGVPVLISNLPVFEEVYEDSVMYHDRFDKNDMKDKLKHLLSDKQLQSKIVRDGRLKIQDFNAKRFAEDFYKIIKI